MVGTHQTFKPLEQFQSPPKSCSAPPSWHSASGGAPDLDSSSCSSLPAGISALPTMAFGLVTTRPPETQGPQATASGPRVEMSPSLRIWRVNRMGGPDPGNDAGAHEHALP